MPQLPWGPASLRLLLAWEEDGPTETGAPVRIARAGDVDPEERAPDRSGQPLVEIHTAEELRARGHTGYAHSRVGKRLRHVRHTSETRKGEHVLHVEQADPTTGLHVVVSLAIHPERPVVHCTTRVRNEGDHPVTLLAVTSLALSAPLAAGVDRLDLWHADSAWVAENRWHREPLRWHLPDIDTATHGEAPRGRFTRTGRGPWSTAEHLPMGVLVDRDGGTAWAWQIEHNGPWHWELGEFTPVEEHGYLALLGPTDAEHQWHRRLAPGESFTGVPVALATGAGMEGAIAALTQHRRARRAPHPDRERLPLVFNDYMNTLEGDPTEEKLLPLVDAAAAVGAEVFCIDAGWYATGDDWWDAVGEWLPSHTRFPRGLAEVIGRIRDAGMVPGLWLEPEVVGVRSPVAARLPEEAFWRRFGTRVTEHGRHHLDLRHPAAREHLDQAVDRLVEEFGVGYFKLDHNIAPGVGSADAGESAGQMLIESGAAHLDWLRGVLARHPGLTLENCGSGAMRADPAVLGVLQLQSTSDQRQPLRYPAVAASAPMSITPEQAGNWAYPQPDMTDEEIAFTLCTGLAGRMYLSGHLDRMDSHRFALVKEAVAVYRETRAHLARARPFWPLGPPGWEDGWIASGLRTAGTAHLTVWRRPGASERIALPLPTDLAEGRVEVLHPRSLPPWDTRIESGHLVVETAPAPSARVFRITRA